MWENPEAHIGEVDPGDVVETDDGLFVKRGRIDLDRPFAEQVFHLLERRRVKEFSFGYDRCVTPRPPRTAPYNLLDVDLFELGPTLKGMNPETELLAVKALGQSPTHLARAVLLKAGARHSTRNGRRVDPHPCRGRRTSSAAGDTVRHRHPRIRRSRGRHR